MYKFFIQFARVRFVFWCLKRAIALQHRKRVWKIRYCRFVVCLEKAQHPGSKICLQALQTFWREWMHNWYVRKLCRDSGYREWQGLYLRQSEVFEIRCGKFVGFFMNFINSSCAVASYLSCEPRKEFVKKFSIPRNRWCFNPQYIWWEWFNTN